MGVVSRRVKHWTCGHAASQSWRSHTLRRPCHASHTCPIHTHTHTSPVVMTAGGRRRWDLLRTDLSAVSPGNQLMTLRMVFVCACGCGWACVSVGRRGAACPARSHTTLASTAGTSVHLLEPTQQLRRWSWRPDTHPHTPSALTHTHTHHSPRPIVPA